MRLNFMNRSDELRRLKKAFSGKEGSFCCLYGRRRCGKSRLLQECLPEEKSVYYVADESEAALQRNLLARQITGQLRNFDQVAYPDWNSLLERWFNEAQKGSVLALDEFPYLAAVSPELPSVLQKFADRLPLKGAHMAICGSSQRMMQGLVLDSNAPLYGRAKEIIHVKPLGAGWISEALKLSVASEALAAFAVWGGVPRYWELAAEYASTWDAVKELVLEPSGVLHDEPWRLLLDDLRDAVQPASILSLIGQGCHRISEIAGRLGKPATSLSRPLQRLIDLGFIRREYPFGLNEKNTKRTVYRISDPFFLFWSQYVQPNRSRLDSGEAVRVQQEIRRESGRHIGQIWEELVRLAVPRLEIGGRSWSTAGRWWGTGLDGADMECDVVAESVDQKVLLVGEVKMDIDLRKAERLMAELESKARRLPHVGRYEKILPVIFSCSKTQTQRHVSLTDVLSVLK